MMRGLYDHIMSPLAHWLAELFVLALMIAAFLAPIAISVQAYRSLAPRTRAGKAAAAIAAALLWVALAVVFYDAVAHIKVTEKPAGSRFLGL